MASFDLGLTEEILLDSSELLSNFFALFEKSDCLVEKLLETPPKPAAGSSFLDFVNPIWATPFDDLTGGLNEAQIQGLADSLLIEISSIPQFANPPPSEILWESLGPWKTLLLEAQVRHLKTVSCEVASPLGTTSIFCCSSQGNNNCNPEMDTAFNFPMIATSLQQPQLNSLPQAPTVIHILTVECDCNVFYHFFTVMSTVQAEQLSKLPALGHRYLRLPGRSIVCGYRFQSEELRRQYVSFQNPRGPLTSIPLGKLPGLPPETVIYPIEPGAAYQPAGSAQSPIIMPSTGCEPIAQPATTALQTVRDTVLQTLPAFTTRNYALASRPVKKQRTTR